MSEKQGIPPKNSGKPHSNSIQLINSGPLMNAERPASPPIPRNKKMREAREILEMILQTPVVGGKYYELDGTLDLATIAQLNTTAQTRMMIQLVSDAMNGKPDAIKMVSNIMGWNAPLKADVSINRPVFIDDIPRPSSMDNLIDVTPDAPVVRVNGRIEAKNDDD